MIDTQNRVVSLDLHICHYAFSLEHKRLNEKLIIYLSKYGN